MNATEGQENLTTDSLQLPSTNGIYLAYNIYLSICMILGLSLNSFVILVQFRSGDKTSSDWFIVFINLYDFLISSLIIPIFLTYSTGLWKLYGNDVICKVHMTLCHFTIFSSAFLIVGLALERYFKVCKPTRFNLSRRFSRNLCIHMSIATFTFSLPSAFIYDNSSGDCELMSTGLIPQIFKFYYLLNTIVFVISFAIVIFSYSNIAVVIMKSKVNIAKYSSVTDNDHAKNKYMHYITLLCCEQRNYNTKTSESTCQQSTEIEKCSINHQQVFVIYESNSGENNALAQGQRIGVNRAENTLTTPGTKVTKLNKRLETTRLTFLLCFIFVLTWAPPWIWYAVAVILERRNFAHQTFVACNFFLRRSYMINIVTNPLLMISLNTKFRKYGKDTIMCKKQTY